LRFIQQIKTVPLYIAYFLKVVDRHSLQAPFIFQFYTDLVEGIKNQHKDPEIEKIRKAMLADKTRIIGIDYGAGSNYVSDTSRRISKIAKKGISSPKSCRLISCLARYQRPQTIIELGTSLGISTAYLSRATPKGKIFTFEGNTDLCDCAKLNWNILSCDNIELVAGDIDQTLAKILDKVPRVDFAIIDANHTKSALLDYYGMIKQRISTEGLIFIDDIRWSVEMYEGWLEITKDPAVKLSIEFLQNGLLFFKKGLSKQHYILSY